MIESNINRYAVNKPVRSDTDRTLLSSNSLSIVIRSGKTVGHFNVDIDIVINGASATNTRVYEQTRIQAHTWLALLVLVGAEIILMWIDGPFLRFTKRRLDRFNDNM